jgi:hypothetical protein
MPKVDRLSGSLYVEKQAVTILHVRGAFVSKLRTGEAQG